MPSNSPRQTRYDQKLDSNPNRYSKRGAVVAKTNKTVLGAQPKANGDESRSAMEVTPESLSTRSFCPISAIWLLTDCYSRSFEAMGQYGFKMMDTEPAYKPQPIIYIILKKIPDRFLFEQKTLRKSPYGTL